LGHALKLIQGKGIDCLNEPLFSTVLHGM